MKLVCKRCETAIEIPPETTRSPDARLVCPTCGARYRLRPRSTPPPTRAVSPPPRSSLTPTTPLPSTAGIDPEGRTVATPSGGVLRDIGAGSPGSGSAPGAPRPLLSEAFQAGDLLAGRYRIVGFLARGGMGEVYEAEDTALQQHVALKTISAHSSDDTAIDRFKREIALARTVTHPNVCRIFDLGQHQIESPSGLDFPPITFLTMELLRGETLSQRLRRGPLSLDEALPVIRQMCAALEAAHGAKIVHRDFKSENVFLEPSGDGLRVVVTDFGVARGGDADPFASRVTGAGIVGTPAYMAPEQIQNEEVTPSADLYALGVVIYEMISTRLPYESDNPLTSAVKRLQEPPTPPTVYVTDLPPAWEQVILRCLERLPEDRFASAGEVVAALERPAGDAAASAASSTPATSFADLPSVPPAHNLSGETRSPPAASAGPAVPTTRHDTARPARPPSAAALAPPQVMKKREDRGRVRLLGGVLAAVVLLSLALYAFNQLRKTADRFTPRRSIAVLSFRNLTGDAEVAWLATALSEMLTTELARGEALRTIPGDNAARIERELGLTDNETLTEELLARARTLLGSDFLVLGSYTHVSNDAGRELRLDLRLQDAALGETLASFSENGDERQLFELVGRLGDAVRAELGISRTDDAEDPLAGLPVDPEAGRLYAEALDLMRDAELDMARDRLQRAAAIEPRNPLIQSALSSAWEAQGFPGRAAEAAQRAFELSSHLPREDRLVVEGHYREIQGDYAAAAEIYRTLREYFPDDLEYGLRLVAAENDGRQPLRARQAIDELRLLPAPISEDPRIDLAEANAAGLLGEFDDQAEAATRAAARAELLGANHLVAQARLAQSQAYRFLGQPRQAEDAARQAHDLYTRLHNPADAALALTAVANALVDRGRFDEAAASYRQALADYRRIGDQGGTAFALNNLGLVLKKKGELGRAEELYEQAETIYRETGDRLGLANTLNNLGVLLVSRDRLSTARERFEQSQEIWDNLGADASSRAYNLNNVAAILHRQGKLWESREMHRQALEIRRQMGQKISEVTSLVNLGLVLTDLGELQEAEEHLMAALDLAREIGERSATADALFALGELHLARGRLDQARGAHDEALELRRELEARLEVDDSRIALARLSLAQNDSGAAEAGARSAAEHCRRDGRQADEALARALLAYALSLQDKSDEARRESDEAGILVTGTERAAVALEVALLRARTAARTGQPVAALDELADVEKRSDSLGFVGLRLRSMIAWAEARKTAGGLEQARAKLDLARTEAAVQGYAGLEAIASRALSD